MDIYSRRGTDRTNTPKKNPKSPLTQSLCPFHVPQCRTDFLWSSTGSTLKSRRVGVVQTHIRSFSLFCTQICIPGPCWRFSSREKFLISHSSDSSWFKWTLLVELALLVHLAQRSCQSCSWPARSPILPGLADALGSALCAQPSPACTCVHPSSARWQNNGSHSSPNGGAAGKSGLG